MNTTTTTNFRLIGPLYHTLKPSPRRVGISLLVCANKQYTGSYGWASPAITVVDVAARTRHQQQLGVYQEEGLMSLLITRLVLGLDGDLVNFHYKELVLL